MELIGEIFDPHFLFRNSVYISLLVGLACPLAGAYLILRRLIFLGVALPQVSSCGIAFAFALPAWGLVPHMHDRAEERALAFAGSIVFTLVAILLLALLERRGRGLVEGRIATAYVLAGAWSILLLVENPFGEHGMLELLRGEIISVSNTDLLLTAATFAVVSFALLIYQKEFLLVSFDREMAITLKKKVVFWDAFLFTLIGLTISMSVLSVGPLVAFGFLIIPPLISYLFARTMRQFIVFASIIGGICALVGFAIAYRKDLPVGPTDVALLGVVFALAFIGKRIVQWMQRKRKAGPAELGRPASPAQEREVLPKSARRR
jgi:ABC-type Mn2+/Zn2+ transport system permease subunit